MSIDEEKSEMKKIKKSTSIKNGITFVRMDNRA